MQKLQFYIKGERVDLFKDETVSITESIQNVRDIEKIFTSFTKTFSLPASRVNNKIFKHYYNFDIVNGFDARLKVNATIEINDLPFKNGKVKLEGVDMKQSKPHTYRITFFGNTVELKDLLGDDKLQSLPLSQYNEIYSSTDVFAQLQRNPEFEINSVIVPLITHTQRLYYDSTDHTSNNGNLHWTSDSGHLHGVKWNELKPALRVNKIIEAIEEKYTITNGYFTNLKFNGGFFKNTSNRVMNDLFMWLHRKSGKVENLAGGQINEQVIDVFEEYIDNDRVTMYNGENLETGVLPALNRFRVKIEPEVDDVEYYVRVERNAETQYQSGALTGTNFIDLKSIYEDYSNFVVYVSSSESITFTSAEWQILYYDYIYNNPYPDVVIVNIGTTTTFFIPVNFEFIITQQVPDIKVIDFITGLFKMFNLTAYVDEQLSNSNNTYITVKPLDEFYETFNTYDISKYVDINKQVVDSVLPYRRISLTYKDTKTFLANRYTQLANKQWGQVSYSTNEPELAGALYKIEVPFGHMQFERLRDAENNLLKDIQYGYNVNESQNAYKGSPLLFYPIRTDTGGISFANGINSSTGDITSKQYVNTINLPSNSVTFTPTNNANRININFHNEINEWTGTTQFTQTLFEVYYKNYLVETFSQKRRLTKVTAYLPIKLFIKIELNDRIEYNNKLYTINTMKTNLISGKTDFELLNVV